MSHIQRILVISLLVTISFHHLHSQSLGQDADGFSTIIIPTVTFNLDVENKIASFVYYDNTWKRDAYFNDSKPEGPCFEFSEQGKSEEGKIVECLNRVWRDKQKAYNTSKNSDYITFGGDLKGSSADGLATIISEGTVSTSVAINGLFGYNWTRQKYNSSYASRIATNSILILESKKEFKSKTNELEKLINTMISDGNMIKSQRTYYSLQGMTKSDNILEKISQRIEELETKGAYEIIYDRKKTTTEEKLKLAKSVAQKIDSISKGLGELDKIKMINATTKLEKKRKADSIDIVKKMIYDVIHRYEIRVANTEGVKELGLSEVENPLDRSAWDKNKKALDKVINSNEYSLYIMEGKAKSLDIKSLLQLYKEILLIASDQQKIENKIKSLRKKFRNTTSGIVYLRGGFNGDNFKLDLDNDSTTINSRFQDIVFNGNRIEIGASLQTKRYHYFGLSFARNYTNNKNEQLEQLTFELQQTDTIITDGVFSSSKEIKALSGPFDRFSRYDLNFDYAWLIPLSNRLNPSNKDPSGSIYLSLNPYIRHRIYENAENLKNNTIMGVGVHAYSTKDNKIIGGLFVQTNDVFGVQSKEGAGFLERINFGVIVKFAIKGFNPEDG